MGPENWPRFAVGQGWGLLLLDTLSAIVASSSDEYGSLLLRGDHLMTSRPKVKTTPRNDPSGTGLSTHALIKIKL